MANSIESITYRGYYDSRKAGLTKMVKIKNAAKYYQSNGVKEFCAPTLYNKLTKILRYRYYNATELMTQALLVFLSEKDYTYTLYNIEDKNAEDVSFLSFDPNIDVIDGIDLNNRAEISKNSDGDIIVRKYENLSIHIAITDPDDDTTNDENGGSTSGGGSGNNDTPGAEGWFDKWYGMSTYMDIVDMPAEDTASGGSESLDKPTIDHPIIYKDDPSTGDDEKEEYNTLTAPKLELVEEVIITADEITFAKFTWSKGMNMRNSDVDIIIPVQSKWTFCYDDENTVNNYYDRYKKFNVYGTSYFSKKAPYSDVIYLSEDDVEVLDDAFDGDLGYGIVNNKSDTVSHSGCTMYIGNSTITGITKDGKADVMFSLNHGDVVNCDYYGLLGKVQSASSENATYGRYNITRSEYSSTKTGLWYCKKSGDMDTLLPYDTSVSLFTSEGYMRTLYKATSSTSGEYIKVYSSGNYILQKYSIYSATTEKKSKSSSKSNVNYVNTLYNNESVSGSTLAVSYPNEIQTNFFNVYAFTPCAQDNIFNASALKMINIKRDSYAIYIPKASNAVLSAAKESLDNFFDPKVIYEDKTDEDGNTYKSYVDPFDVTTNLTSISGKFIVVNKFEKSVDTVKSADEVYSKNNIYLYKDGAFVLCTDYNTNETLYVEDIAVTDYGSYVYYKQISKMSDGSWKTSGSAGYVVSETGTSKIEGTDMFVVYKPTLTASSTEFFLVRVELDDYSYLSSTLVDGSLVEIETTETFEDTFQTSPYYLKSNAGIGYVRNALTPGEDHTSRGSVITKSGGPLQEYKPQIHKISTYTQKTYEHLDPAKEINDNGGSKHVDSVASLLNLKKLY